MIQFLAAFTVFIALHSVPAIPTLRAALIARLGHTTYIAGYSAVSLVAVAWLFYAMFNIDYIELWQPSAWQGLVTFVAAPVGLFLVLAGLVSPNPYSTTARAGDVPGAIVAVTRHPVLWGFLVWALGHIPPNGDLRSVLLFGGFVLFTVGSIAMMEKRNRKKHGTQWPEQVSKTSIVPFRAVIQRRASLRVDGPMILALVITVAIGFWLLIGGHAYLFGTDPILFVENF